MANAVSWIFALLFFICVSPLAGAQNQAKDRAKLIDIENFGDEDSVRVEQPIGGNPGNTGRPCRL